MEVFDNRRTTNSTHLLYMRMARLVLRIAIQVWGIAVVYFCLGLSTTFYLIDESDSTLSVFIAIRRIGVNMATKL